MADRWQQSCPGPVKCSMMSAASSPGETKEMTVSSTHENPERPKQFAKKMGHRVILAGCFSTINH